MFNFFSYVFLSTLKFTLHFQQFHDFFNHELQTSESLKKASIFQWFIIANQEETISIYAFKKNNDDEISNKIMTDHNVKYCPLKPIIHCFRFPAKVRKKLIFSNCSEDLNVQLSLTFQLSNFYNNHSTPFFYKLLIQEFYIFSTK